MDQKEYNRRATAVRKQLKTMNIDALISLGLENVRYLTGFTGHASWVLVLPRQVVLLTDSRYTEQAQGECVGCKIIERKETLASEAEKIFSKHKGIEMVGIEDGCSVALLKKVRKDLTPKVKPVCNLVEKGRKIKTDEELKLIRKAGKISFDSMDWALKQLKVGMTELEVAALYEHRLRHYGAKFAFETIVCFGPNGSRNHHQPGSRKLRKNDMILLDFGANYQGYCSDTTRCFAVGKVTAYFRKVYEAVARGQKNAISQVKAGMRGIDLDAAARSVIEEYDIPAFPHGLGHGLGMQVHEAPYMNRVDKKTIVEAGNVVTIEPGVYLPGKFGVRLEDDVLVTDTGAVILSKDKRFDINPDIIPILKI